VAKAYLDPQDVRLLEEHASSLRDRLLIRILFRTGCRISEVLGLRVEDVDFEQGTLTIEHLKVRVSRTCHHCGARLARSHVFCPDCGTRVSLPEVREQERHRIRTVAIDPATLAMLRDYIERGGPVSRNEKLLLFEVSRSHARRIVRECARRAGLEPLVNPETGRLRGVSPHRLRDAFAVMAVQRDDSTDGVRMLQEQLGHASIGTTMRYRKVAGQELREWYAGLWREEEDKDRSAAGGGGGDPP